VMWLSQPPDERDVAREAVRMRDEFLAATSHELRTPLSHIKGFVSTLRKVDIVPDAATRADFLAEIEREADRLAQLVEDLLDVSRIDASASKPATRVVTSIVALVEGGLDRVRSSLEQHRVETLVAPDLPAVCVEASQIERVIANLLDNAAKYSPPASPVRVCARRLGSDIVVRVEDDGLGIPPEHFERIFEPYFREPAAGYPVKRGSGLGLSICRRIIAVHGGRIWAENRDEHGAAFSFTLPIASPGRADNHSRR
jgi:two-component system, OmpR family, sensor histidine kinase KdpD